MALPVEELAKASATYQVALTSLGVTAAREIMYLWRDVSYGTGGSMVGVSKFVTRAVKLIGYRRKRALAITDAFVRLSRALATGFSTPHLDGFPLDDGPAAGEATSGSAKKEASGESPRSTPETHKKVSVEHLNVLREEFVQSIEKYAPTALKKPVRIEDENPVDDKDESYAPEKPDYGPYEPYKLKDWTDDDLITIEDIDDLQETIDSQEDAADAEMRHLMKLIAQEKLEDEMAAIAEEKAIKQEKAEKAKEEAYMMAGLTAARHGERIVMNGGRHTLVNHSDKDKRAIGFVRVHHPEHGDAPCGFCAMLISRSVFYKSAETAQHKGQNAQDDAFHSNCHCSAEPVYSKEQFETSDRFKMNRELSELWKKSSRSNDSTWKQDVSDHVAGRASAADKKFQEEKLDSQEEDNARE